MRGEWRLLEAIVQYHKEHGYMPSYDEMCELTGYKSKGYVKDLIHRLINKGYIVKDYSGCLKPRAFRLNERMM